MTPRILFALTREYLHRGLPMMLLTIAYVVGGPVGMYYLLQAESGGYDPDALDPRTMQRLFLIVGGFALLAATFHGHNGMRRGAYVLPISTRTFATWQMVSSAIVVVLLNLVCVSLLDAFIGVGWPILAPCCFMAMAAVVCFTAYWDLLAFRWWKPVLLFVGMLAVIPWVEWRFGNLQRGDEDRFWILTLPDAIGMAAVAVAAHLLGVRFLERDRHRRSERSSLDQFVETADDGLLERTTRGGTRHTSPGRALGWALWARTRLVFLAGSLLFSSLVLLFAAKLLWDREPLDLEPLASMVVTLSGCAGMLAMTGIGGVAGAGRNDERMPAFVAAMPVSDREMGHRFVLDTAWAALLSTAVVLVLAAIPVGLSIAMFGTESAGDFVERHPLMAYLTPSLCLAVCWIAAGNAASIALTGRRHLVGATFATCAVTVVATMVLVNVVLSDALAAIVTPVLVGALATLLVVLTLGLHVVALRRGMIGGASTIVGLVLWCGAAAMFVTATEHTVARAFLACAASLTALPLAAIPLAVRWNRHR